MDMQIIWACPVRLLSSYGKTCSLIDLPPIFLRISATIRHIVHHDGLRGLYRGLGPTILGYLPTWAIYFAVYDGIKRKFGEQSAEDASAVRHVYPAAQVKGYQPLSRDHPWTLHLFSAMAAGATSTLCTNPLWVIKTRFMVRSFFGVHL